MATSERAANVVSEPCSILGRTCSLPDCDRPCDEAAMLRQTTAVYEEGWNHGSRTTWKAMAEVIRKFGDRNVIGALDEWESKRGFGSSRDQ